MTAFEKPPEVCFTIPFVRKLRFKVGKLVLGRQILHLFNMILKSTLLSLK